MPRNRAATYREVIVRARRTIQLLAAIVGGLATVAATTTPAHAADGVALSGPPTVWAIDGDQATELGLTVVVDPPGNAERTCGTGRSAPLKQVGSVIVHAVVQACHTYLPETRRFTILNRTYVCERAIGARECTPGTTLTRIPRALLVVEFRADGGNHLFGWGCIYDSARMTAPDAKYCTAGEALEGARGHRYNAWAYTYFDMNDDGVYEITTPVSTTTEQLVE